METTKIAKKEQVDMKLEVVLLGVTDVDRAKSFYQNLGWRLDADFVISEDFRVIQFTPPQSEASIIFGKGVAFAAPGASKNMVLAVSDIDAAREELLAGGVKVSEVFHFAGGPFYNAAENSRVPGRDPENRTYFTFASFEDPDGNRWLLQEITTRLPGRLWETTQAQNTDVAMLADLLRETSERHDRFEKTHAGHDWWDWYAPYLSSRLNSHSPEEAATIADRYIEDVISQLPE